MKIAITVQGSSLDDPLDPRFGRARRFLVVDTVSGATTIRDNTVNLNATQGAGIQTAQNVADAGATAVITGHVGPKAFKVLQAAGIAIYLAETSSARAALEQYQHGALRQQQTADVEGHWS